MGLGNKYILSFLADSHSDHSSFWVALDFPAISRQFSWKPNPFWLTLFPDPIPELLASFFLSNMDSADIEVVWDAAKAFLRGQFINIIQQIKTNTKAWETLVLGEAGRAEEAYVDNLTDDTKRSWLAAQSMARQVELQLAENKGSFLQQKQYEGENTGHMLEMLIRNQQCSSHIDKLYDSQGCLQSLTQDLL